MAQCLNFNWLHILRTGTKYGVQIRNTSVRQKTSNYNFLREWIRINQPTTGKAIVIDLGLFGGKCLCELNTHTGVTLLVWPMKTLSLNFKFLQSWAAGDIRGKVNQKLFVFGEEDSITYMCKTFLFLWLFSPPTFIRIFFLLSFLSLLSFILFHFDAILSSFPQGWDPFWKRTRAGQFSEALASTCHWSR